MAAYGIACAIILLLSANIELAKARVVNSSVSPDVSGQCTLVNSRGYKCEEYEVRTPDGYILGMQRIPEGRSSGENGGRKEPVLLQHGIYVDGTTWVLNSPEESLAFVLADNGFDVWIANTRGTTSSRRHAFLDPSTNEYWSWSWDELAMYDLPSNVDFVYSKTGRKLHYIGHSLGTIEALAALSEGKLVDQLKSVVLLSPVGYLSHMTSPLGASSRAFSIEYLRNFLGVAEFNLRDERVVNFLRAACVGGLNCYDLTTLFTGYNCCLNVSTADVFLKYNPQPTSTKNVVHLSQLIRRGVPAKFDYQSIETNMKHYGQSEPPVYTYSNIPQDLPLFIGTGDIDWISDRRDVDLLLNDLRFRNKDKLKVHFVKGYGHLDIIMAISAKTMLYDQVISFLKLA